MALTPQQQVAAVLEAQNHSRKDIARMAGVSESHIAHHRNDPEYRAEVARLREHGLEALQSAVGRVVTEIVGAGVAAVKTLLDNLEAVDGDGQPLWSVRQQAADSLLKYFVSVGGFKDKNALESQQQAAAHASITFKIEDTRPTAIEGTAEEA